jgi:hypothetical protein
LLYKKYRNKCIKAKPVNNLFDLYLYLEQKNYIFKHISALLVGESIRRAIRRPIRAHSSGAAVDHAIAQPLRNRPLSADYRHAMLSSVHDFELVNWVQPPDKGPKDKLQGEVSGILAQAHGQISADTDGISRTLHNTALSESSTTRQHEIRFLGGGSVDLLLSENAVLAESLLQSEPAAEEDGNDRTPMEQDSLANSRLPATEDTALMSSPSSRPYVDTLPEDSSLPLSPRDKTMIALLRSALSSAEGDTGGGQSVVQQQTEEGGQREDTKGGELSSESSGRRLVRSEAVEEGPQVNRVEIEDI